jgi:hypothetical protein
MTTARAKRSSPYISASVARDGTLLKCAVFRTLSKRQYLRNSKRSPSQSAPNCKACFASPYPAS